VLFGGKLGDLFGRKWTLIAGLGGFAIASAIGGLAQSFTMLVAAHALQGVFGAMLAPSALGILTVTFAGSPDRPSAFGIFSAVAASGASVGLLLGGALALVSFIPVERRAQSPLVPLHIPWDRVPGGAYLSILFFLWGVQRLPLPQLLHAAKPRLLAA